MAEGLISMSRWRSALPVLIWLLPACAGAQPSATAVFNRPVVEPGDTFTMRVLVVGSQAEPRSVDLSAWYAAGFSPENVLSRSAWSRSGARWVQQYTLISFDSALLRLPPVYVHTHLGEALPTNPLELRIHNPSVPADVAAAAPIRDILREPAHWTDYWLEALSVLLALALLTWWLKRKKPAPLPAAVPLAPPLPATPLHETALAQLLDLQQKKYCASGQHIAFYAEISLIVRSYIEHRYAQPALESTTREIIASLPADVLPTPQRDTLRNLLQEADLAKYADRQPLPQACENALAAARRFVLATHSKSG